jgi:hypothetical protein
MYYDVYKKGFAFYCDHNGIPYSILNAVAKKYVRIFVCRDLFIDDTELPDYSSPLIKINESEDKIEKEKKMEKQPGMNLDILKNAPFAKLKRYNMEDKSSDKSTELRKVNINKFIYKGKTVNFSILQRVLKVRPTMLFANSQFTAMFEKEHESQQNAMSYSNYKKMTQKTEEENLEQEEEQKEDLVQEEQEQKEDLEQEEEQKEDLAQKEDLEQEEEQKEDLEQEEEQKEDREQEEEQKEDREHEEEQKEQEEQNEA